jgi:hypothetical protein
MIDPKYLYSIAHKKENMLLVWWYNIDTGEFRSSDKDIHSDPVFKDIAYKPGWIRGRVFAYEGKVFLIIYAERIPAGRLADIVDKANMRVDTPIRHIIGMDGEDMSYMIERETRDTFHIMEFMLSGVPYERVA